MKTVNYFLICIVLFFATSCTNKDDDSVNCEAVSCFVPITELKFNLLDKLTNENIFESQLYDRSLLKVLNTDNQQDVVFSFLEDNPNIIYINPIELSSEVKSFTFKISEKLLFVLEIETQNVDKGECCSYTTYSKIEIKQTDFKVNTENGFYQILLE